MDTPYENLANAIILQAVKDYRKALRILSRYPYNRPARYERGSIERFFRSEWFGILTRLDPETLIRRLREEAS